MSWYPDSIDGDRILWAAVLRRAIYDYVIYKGVRSKKLEWQRAFRYVFSRGLRYENGFSFEEVCDLFGWDPDYLRSLTAKLDRSDLKHVESLSLRGENTYELVRKAAKESSRWRSSNFAVPFCPLFPKVTGDRKPARVVKEETIKAGHKPVVRWQTVEANG